MKIQGLGKYVHMKRLCSPEGHFNMLALDQRPPIFNIIEKIKKRKFKYSEVVECKKIISSSLTQFSTATLIDPYFSIPNILNTVKNKGLIITLEDHKFKEISKGRLSKRIDKWSVEKIKKIGGDAVKVLVWYRPDANSNSIQHQKKFVEIIGKECEKFDIPFLLELLVFPFKNDPNHTSKYQEHNLKKTDHVIESVYEFSKNKYKVDIFKVECPVHSYDLDHKNISKKTKQAFRDLSIATNKKPWVMLSAGMIKNTFFKCLNLAYSNQASGYLAGRSIWKEAFDHYPNLNRIKNELNKSASNYMKKINKLTKLKAKSIDVFLNDNLTIKQPKNFLHNFKKF